MVHSRLLRFQELVEGIITKITSLRTNLNYYHSNDIHQQRKALAAHREHQRLADAHAAAVENKARAQLAKKECFDELKREACNLVNSSEQQQKALHMQHLAHCTALVQENATLYSKMKTMIKEHSLHEMNRCLRGLQNRIDEIKNKQSQIADEAQRLDSLEKKTDTLDQKTNELHNKINYLIQILTAPSAPPAY